MMNTHNSYLVFLNLLQVLNARPSIPSATHGASEANYTEDQLAEITETDFKDFFNSRVAFADETPVDDLERQIISGLLAVNGTRSVIQQRKVMVGDPEERQDRHLRQWQEFYKLDVTGVIDSATKLKMMDVRTSTCGVRDEIGLRSAYRHWPLKTAITWHFASESIPRYMSASAEEMNAFIQRAFCVWSRYANLVWRHVTDPRQADIKIYFGTKKHSNISDLTDTPFKPDVHAHAAKPPSERMLQTQVQDNAIHVQTKIFGLGSGTEDATWISDNKWVKECRANECDSRVQSIYGDIHINAEADVEWDLEDRDGTTNLMFTLVHEIGHAIGLWHTHTPMSVMYNKQMPQFSWDINDLQLDRVDQQNIVGLYGRFKYWQNICGHGEPSYSAEAIEQKWAAEVTSPVTTTSKAQTESQASTPWNLATTTATRTPPVVEPADLFGITNGKEDNKTDRRLAKPKEASLFARLIKWINAIFNSVFG